MDPIDEGSVPLHDAIQYCRFDLVVAHSDAVAALACARLGLPFDGDETGSEQAQLVVLAERVLLQDFAARVKQGEFELFGMQFEPELIPMRVRLTNSTDEEITFDLTGIVSFGIYRFERVRALRRRQPYGSGVRLVSNKDLLAVEPTDVPSFSCEVLVALLDEHVRRIMAAPHPKLHIAAKYSMVPLVRRRMRDRAAQGVLLPTLAKEMAWLAHWIGEAAKDLDTPQAKSLMNVLRHDYNALKAQSKGILA